MFKALTLGVRIIRADAEDERKGKYKKDKKGNKDKKNINYGRCLRR